MHKTMIVALAALTTLLLMPPPGFTRESRQQGSQPPGSYSQRSSPGSHQRGIQPRSFSGQRSSSRHDGYRGVSPRSGYRGVYSHSGYRSGGYPYRSYRHGGYPYYRSNVHFSGGVWVGPGWYPGWGWPYSYPYYSAPPVIIEQAPTEYIEKGQEAEESNYLYRCSDPEGYYPTIQRCPSGWTKELPSTPPDQ